MISYPISSSFWIFREKLWSTKPQAILAYLVRTFFCSAILHCGLVANILLPNPPKLKSFKIPWPLFLKFFNIQKYSTDNLQIPKHSRMKSGPSHPSSSWPRNAAYLPPAAMPSPFCCLLIAANGCMILYWPERLASG